MGHTRRKVVLLILAGALAPSTLAVGGYFVAGSPHADCDDAEAGAFYRLATPFFALGALAGVAALLLITRTRAEDTRHWFAESFAVLAVLVTLDAVLPGDLHHPGAAVVIALAVFALFTWFISWPVTLVLLAIAGTKLVRRRHDETVARRERSLYLFLVGWLLATVLPTVIVLLSLNADPLCFTF